MSSNSRNRRSRQREEEELNSEAEYFRNALDDLANNTFSATFYIAIGANSRDRNIFNHIFPIFSMRDPIFESNQNSEASVFVSNFFKEYINSLKRKERLWRNLKKNHPFKFTKNMKIEECTICLNNFSNNQFLRKLDCEHTFHKKCIDKWLMKGNQCCPMCRKEPFIGG